MTLTQDASPFVLIVGMPKQVHRPRLQHRPIQQLSWQSSPKLRWIRRMRTTTGLRISWLVPMADESSVSWSSPTPLRQPVRCRCLGFNNDAVCSISIRLIRSWGEEEPVCNNEIDLRLEGRWRIGTGTFPFDWIGASDASTRGAPTTAAYTDQYNNYAWQEFTEFAMEAVDADNDWAAYKLVGTMADESKRIVFHRPNRDDWSTTSARLQQ